MIYKGDWRDDKFNGSGTFYSPPGELFEGNFRDGKIADGRVKIYYPCGNYYEGDLRGGLRNGKGVIYYSNGDQYDGEW